MRSALVLKPIRGRGSQGVVVVKFAVELATQVNRNIESSLYGDDFILEELLPGEEITITVMPPGSFTIGAFVVEKDTHWALREAFVSIISMG